MCEVQRARSTCKKRDFQGHDMVQGQGRGSCRRAPGALGRHAPTNAVGGGHSALRHSADTGGALGWIGKMCGIDAGNSRHHYTTNCAAVVGCHGNMCRHSNTDLT